MATMQVDKEQVEATATATGKERGRGVRPTRVTGRNARPARRTTTKGTAGLPPAGLESTVPARSERQQRSTTTDAMQDHKNKQEATATATDRNAQSHAKGDNQRKLVLFKRINTG